MRAVLALLVLIPAFAIAATDGLLETPDEKSDMRGETTRVMDPYGSNAPNPLFLSSLTNKPWWNEQSEGRLPILVTEPIGLTRMGQSVSVIKSFPAGTMPESLRVVTPYGRELPSQVRVVNAEQRMFEAVFFLSRLDADAQMPLFVYYGSKPVQLPCPAAPDPHFRIEERAKGMALINGRLQAEFSRNAGLDRYTIWRMVKGQGAEFNLIGVFPPETNVFAYYGVPNGTPLRVLEDGPIRKTLSYGAWGENYMVSLYADSPLICVASKSGGQSKGFWLPGGDTLNDVLCYESSEGLKRMPIQYTGGNVPPYTYEHLKEWFKEGWFALLDEAQQQGVGWFFDLAQSGISIQTVGYGYWVTMGAPGQSALYVARDARTEPCRQAYLAWKCPPIVSRGEPQAFTKIEPRVPLLGRDFIRMHIESGRFRPRENANSAREYVEEAESFGGNYLLFQRGKIPITEPSEGPDGKPEPAFLDELVRECHARSMGFGFYTTGFNTPLIRDLVRRGTDGLWLVDEYGWGPAPGGHYPLNEDQRKKVLAGTWDGSFTNFSAADRADFKKRYGADMPDTPKDLADLTTVVPDENSELIKPPVDSKGAFANLSASDLNDPSQFAMFRMLIDAHNLLMSDLASVARENNSNVFITATTSPRNLQIPFPTLNAFNDLESLADSFSSVTVDLYKNDPGWLNGMVKYSRGTQGNRRPIIIIGGYSGWDNREAVENNLNYQLMFGANSICYFALERLCSPWPAMGAKDAFDLIDYTGLGTFAAKSWPLEFVGVLRDRDEFFASIKRKEGTLYEQSIFQYVQGMGFEIPANVIAARHLKQELAAPYKLIIVPNNPTLSDGNAALLRDFVEAGGSLILECASIRNKTLSAMANVSAMGDEKTGKIRLTGVKPPLADWSVDMNSSWQPVKTQPGVEVLATLADGQPAITLSAVGKGKIVCIVPRIGAQLLWDASAKKTTQALRRLVEHTVGYVPVRLEPSGIPVFTTVLTDGNRVVIAAYNYPANPSARPREDVTLTLAGFTNDIGSLVSIRTGRSYPVINGKVKKLALPSRKTDYFMSAPGIPMPQMTIQSASTINQSLKPGMTFLNLRPLPSKQLLAKLGTKQTNTIYVGVLDVRGARKIKPTEFGAQALVAELGKMGQVKAESISDLQAETIGFYDVLIVPSLVEPFASPRGWERNVRDFVEQGGRALLLGRSIGYGEAVLATDLFPEIGKPLELAADKAALQVTLDHPVTSASAYQARFQKDLNNPALAEQYKMPAMKPGDPIESGFPEYVTIQPGPAGMAVVATVERGEAIIVAGAFGQGRVVLSGMTLGCRKIGETGRAPYEEALSPGEKKMLINSVYWLGERSAPPAPPKKTAASSEKSLLTGPDKKIEDLLLQIE